MTEFEQIEQRKMDPQLHCHCQVSVVAWQGVAGTGRTFALKRMKELIEAQGYVVKGFALRAERRKSCQDS